MRCGYWRLRRPNFDRMQVLNVVSQMLFIDFVELMHTVYNSEVRSDRDCFLKETFYLVVSSYSPGQQSDDFCRTIYQPFQS